MPLEFNRVQMTTPLVSLEDARIAARVDVADTTHDAEILLYSLHATNEVLDYLTTGADPAWTVGTVPSPVAAAILELLGWELEDARGGEQRKTATEIWTSLEHRLARFRDPAIA